jgi:hypothetical protein
MSYIWYFHPAFISDSASNVANGRIDNDKFII